MGANTQVQGVYACWCYRWRIYILIARGEIVTTGRTAVRESSVGSRARRLRIAFHLTRRALARLAGVTEEEVYLYEHNLPVCLDCRRRILKELWAKKVEK